MRTTSVSRVRTEGSARRKSGVGEAFWLAGKEIRRAWLSYPASGLFMLFFGFLTISLVSGVFEMVGFGAEGLEFERTFNSFFADFFFVILGCLFVVNVMSVDYMKIWVEDVFSSRTAFLRGLPISTGTLVGGRVISMLFAVPFTVPAFFLPAYFFTELGDLGFSYVWFVGIWLGWGLFCGGVTLLCELGLSGRAYRWISTLLVFGIGLVVVALNLATGAGLVSSSASVAGTGFGFAAAIISIVVGSLGFWLLAWLTVKRVERREVGA